LHRILLVEDDTPVRVIIEHVLLGEGYEVDTAGTAQAGAELLDNGAYDMVIADAKLPDGTGIEVADRAAERAIRTLVITGYAFTLPRESLLRHEMLLKPLRPRERSSSRWSKRSGRMGAKSPNSVAGTAIAALTLLGLPAGDLPSSSTVSFLSLRPGAAIRFSPGIG